MNYLEHAMNELVMVFTAVALVAIVKAFVVSL
jgi:hypothetical protein